jgi:hypothetical protein
LACCCWAPPTDLFLICRALYQDAQFVFFSVNRFIVHDFHAARPWDLPAAQARDPNSESAASTTRYYPYDRLAASEFLRNIVPARCLTDLRFLELVFPPYMPDGWPQDGCAALLDWQATVDWIRGEAKINAPALTLRLVMADGIAPGNGRNTLTEDQGAEILDAYTRIVDPLRPLVREGLAGFYVQAAYPWRRTLHTIRQIDWHGDQWLLDIEQVLKTHFECRTRGRGDAGSCNRVEPSRSIWQRWYELDW